MLRALHPSIRLVPRWPLRELFAVATALVLSLFSLTAAIASEPVRAVSLDCDVLDAPARAELEARVRAELALATGSGGDLRIGCGERVVEVRWRAREGAVSVRSATAATDEPGTRLVDAALTALRTVLEVRDAGSLLSPSQTPPARSPAGRVGTVLGLDGERWAGSIGAGAGAHAGLIVTWDDRWSVGAVAGLLLGLESSETVRADVYRARLFVNYESTPRLRFGLGPEVRDVAVRSMGTSAAGLTAGAVVSAAYCINAGSFAFSVGPTLEALLRPIVARRDELEIFRVPSLLAGLSLEASFGGSASRVAARGKNE